MMEEMPVFVKLEKPDEVKNLLTELRDKIDKSRSALDSIKQLQEKENSYITEWKSNFSTLDSKITTIGEKLGEPEKI